MAKTQDKILTDKQLRFCKEYIIDLNATQACIRAGYSKKTASVIGIEHLRKPKIQNKITELSNKINTKLEITAERIKAEYAKIAFANISDILECSESGTVTLKKSLSELPREITDIIGEISSSETTTGFGGSKSFKIKLHCKLEALKKLGETFEMFKNTNQTPVTVNVNQPLSDSQIDKILENE